MLLKKKINKIFIYLFSHLNLFQKLYSFINRNPFFPIMARAPINYLLDLTIIEVILLRIIFVVVHH